jgi:hypothetical protein
MKVRENFEVPQKIIEQLKRREFRPKSYTVSRLVVCPRKTLFKRTGVPEIVMDEQQLIFARGHGHHGVLEVAYLKEVECKAMSEVKDMRGELIPITGDIDMIGDRITEIFTTTISSSKVQTPEDAEKTFPSKVKQLTAYCHFRHEDEGDLLVFFLFGDYTRFETVHGEKKYVGIRPKLRDFTYSFDEEDKQKIWKLMNTNIEDIEYATKTGQFTILGVGEKWECNNCGWNYKCYGDEPIEARDTDKIISKAMSAID